MNGLAVAVCVLAQAMAPTQGVVLVLPLEARSATLADSADLITTVVASEIRKQSRFTVVTVRDLEGSLNLEMQKQLAGCGSQSCAAEIAGALNTDEVVLGSIGLVGADNLVLGLTRMKAGSAVVLGSATRVIKSGDPGAVLDQVPSVVAELLQSAPSAPAPKATPAPRAAAAPPSRSSAISPDHVELDRYMVPLQGPQHTEMSWPDFYALVGHPELATAYLGRVTARWGLRVGGVVAIVAASFVSPVAVAGATAVILGWVFLAPNFIPKGTLVGGVGTAVSGGLLGTGFILLALLATAAGIASGLGMIYGSYGMGEQPVTDEEIRTLAEEHNRSLDTPAP